LRAKPQTPGRVTLDPAVRRAQSSGWDRGLSDVKPRSNQQQQQENVLVQLKNKNTIMINEEPVFINKNTAKQVLKVYRTLNEENRLKFESMLNEDTKSFKQAVNFALRHK
jgi:biopolymer transport protein ExbD